MIASCDIVDNESIKYYTPFTCDFLRKRSSRYVFFVISLDTGGAFKIRRSSLPRFAFKTTCRRLYSIEEETNRSKTASRRMLSREKFWEIEADRDNDRKSRAKWPGGFCQVRTLRAHSTWRGYIPLAIKAISVAVRKKGLKNPSRYTTLNILVSSCRSSRYTLREDSPP